MVETPIRVSIPSNGQYVRIVRIVATASAAARGLSIDQLDDLALAIDEACGALMALDGTTAIGCAITPQERGVHVQVAGRDADPTSWPPAEWSESLEAMVLDGVASNVETTVVDGGPAIAFDVVA